MSAGPILALLLGLLSAVPGPAVAAPLHPFVEDGRAWPEPPAPARIRFVKAFSGPVDLGIRPSIWGRLVEAVTGPSDDDRLQRPMAVAATAAGELIFVADAGCGCVHRYDLARGRYDRLTMERGARLPSPVGLAAAADGRVFVADSALNAVLVADARDDILRPLPLVPAPQQPTGIALADAASELFVASTGSHSVRRYSLDGRLLREYGRRGSAPGEMNFPTYLWFAPPAELLVSDTLNFRIQRLDVNNGVLGVFGEAGDSSGTLSRPKGVAMDSDGHIYVLDAMLPALQVFDRDGQLLLDLGEQGQGPGQFWLPAGLYVSADDLIFVADAYNGRVQVFRYLGAEP